MILEDFTNDTQGTNLPEQPSTINVIGKTLNFVNKKEKYKIVDFTYDSDCKYSSDCEDIFGVQFRCECIESPSAFMIGLTFLFDAREWQDHKKNNIKIEN
jgi:hypothetical protein